MSEYELLNNMKRELAKHKRMVSALERAIIAYEGGTNSKPRRTRRTYTDDEKLEVLKMLETDTYDVVHDKTGIHKANLVRWWNQYVDDKPTRKGK